MQNFSPFSLFLSSSLILEMDSLSKRTHRISVILPSLSFSHTHQCEIAVCRLREWDVNIQQLQFLYSTIILSRTFTFHNTSIARCISSLREKKLSPRNVFFNYWVCNCRGDTKNTDLILQPIFVFKQALCLIAASVTSMAPHRFGANAISSFSRLEWHRHRRH